MLDHMYSTDVICFSLQVQKRWMFDPLSLTDWTLLGLPTPILLLSAYLLFNLPTSPAGKAVRLSLLPLGTLVTVFVYTSYDFSGGVPQYAVLNYAMPSVACGMVAKLAEYTVTSGRPRRIPMRPTKEQKRTHTANGHRKAVESLQGVKRMEQPMGLWDYLHFLSDPRGISYNFGASFFKPPEKRNVNNRSSFLFSTLCEVLWFIVLADATATIFEMVVLAVPETTITTSQGGSIYIESVPVPFRYFVSTVWTVCIGAGVYICLNLFHLLFTLVSVGLFQLDPAEHPPLFWSPYKASSVRELWGKRWHSAYRQSLTTLGGRVGYAVLGDVGMLMGTFLLSGIVHDLGLWDTNMGMDPWRITGFFFVQSFAIILEGLWFRSTGRKVQGAWGRLWVWAWTTMTAHFAVDAWCVRAM